MGQLSNILRGGPERITWWCPGCKSPHSVPVNPGWSWDGSVEAPTLSPSVLVTSGHFIEGQADMECWCGYNATALAANDEPSGSECVRCHTFIRGGVIEFLSDCSHGLAGRTVPIPPLPDHLRDPAQPD